ncbi:uncharacterized protein G2W53_009518 [Senna tora]|uniref:Uncharacterized protein n=1 Tax=Senna tora TaxID=362788 RepID=A0A835C8B5_9FABA|nr:uncharacterized protein G2W53_009518 [Senna tora]
MRRASMKPKKVDTLKSASQELREKYWRMREENLVLREENLTLREEVQKLKGEVVEAHYIGKRRELELHKEIKVFRLKYVESR